MDHVELQTIVYDNNSSTTVNQVYRFGSNNWLELAQMNSTEKYEGAGWGRSRYEREAEQVTVLGGTSYLFRQFGWWILDWKIGDVGLELQAPAQVISREQLLDIAQTMQQ